VRRLGDRSAARARRLGGWLLVGTLGLGVLTARAGAQSPWVAELQAIWTRYHEDPSRLFAIRDGLEEAIKTDRHVDNLVALAWVSYIIGDLPMSTQGQKLQAYDRGRRAAKQAIELNPKSVGGHFWHGVNTARWGQTNGIIRSLFLLPTVQDEIKIVLDLDPNFSPVYNLAGNVYLEVPRLLGGDLNLAEELFRKGIGQDPRDTAIRIGLAKVLIAKKRIPEARKELEAVLAERSPRSLADWTLKDVKEARQLLDSIKDRS
jgi:tetratricopeptide (TPR) repeat protein